MLCGRVCTASPSNQQTGFPPMEDLPRFYFYQLLLLAFVGLVWMLLESCERHTCLKEGHHPSICAGGS